MSNGRKVSYTLVFGLLALTWPAWGLEPVDRKPIPELISTLKEHGHERIAQGFQLVPVKGAEEGQWTIEKAPLMLTANRKTGEWTISIFHDEFSGSILLIGKGLQSGSSASVRDSGYKSLYQGAITHTSKTALDLAAAYNQQDIDRNMLALDIDGKKVTIAQGDLRKIMMDRVKELEQKRDHLVRNGGSKTEIARTDELIKKYGADTASQKKDSAEPDLRITPVSFHLLIDAGGRFKVEVQDRKEKRVDIALGEEFSEKS